MQPLNLFVANLLAGANFAKPKVLNLYKETKQFIKQVKILQSTNNKRSFKYEEPRHDPWCIIPENHCNDRVLSAFITFWNLKSLIENDGGLNLKSLIELKGYISTVLKRHGIRKNLKAGFLKHPTSNAI